MKTKKILFIYYYITIKRIIQYKYGFVELNLYKEPKQN